MKYTNTPNRKRRRVVSYTQYLRITDLTYMNMERYAQRKYVVAKPSFAYFAVSISTPSESMQTRQAVAIGTSVSKAEGSHVSDSWEILDILIEKSLAEKLSDDVRHFDAHSDINKLQTLKLTDCVQYYGHLS